MKTLALLTLILTLILTASIFAKAETDQPVHLFILSGQSNMQGMDPETGFMTEATKLFGDEKVVYIKVAKGGQPICRWLEEWETIATEAGLDENHRKRIHKGGEVEFYQPILDQYEEMLKQHPKFASITFCWMQGERDAKMQWASVYEESLMGLYQQMSEDLGRDDIIFVVGRLSDNGIGKEQWDQIRVIQVKVADSDDKFAWVDTDDLNDGKNRKGREIKDDLHYSSEGYRIFGERMAAEAIQRIKGK